MKLRYETYSTALASGFIEWGFVFMHEGSEDAEFDLVLGASTPAEAEKKSEESWARNEWAAKAICAASEQQA